MRPASITTVARRPVAGHGLLVMELLDTRSAAALCGLSYSVFRYLRSMGLAPLPAEYRGATAYYSPDDLRAWNDARLEIAAMGKHRGKDIATDNGRFGEGAGTGRRTSG